MLRAISHMVAKLLVLAALTAFSLSLASITAHTTAIPGHQVAGTPPTCCGQV